MGGFAGAAIAGVIGRHSTRNLFRSSRLDLGRKAALKARLIARSTIRTSTSSLHLRPTAAHAPPRARHFLAIVEAGHEMQGRARLGIVNRAISLAIQATGDMTQHDADDVWSSPLATFRSGKGDCEDYAIAKIAALLLAGVPAQDLRLVVVRNLKAHRAHAVLTAWLGDRWNVLDNRRFLLLEDRQVVTEYRRLQAFAVEPAVRTYAQSRPPQMPSAMLKR